MLAARGRRGSGLPQLEAHACGTPCVVGRYSASIEQAVDSRELIAPRGYYSTPDNMVRRPIYSPKDLADHAVFAYKNPSWRQEVGAKGRAHVLEHHNWVTVVPQWVALFEEAYRTVAPAPVEGPGIEGPSA